MPKKLVVMIPAHNEEATIVDVINRIPKQINGIDLIQIVVFNDGSKDKTAEVAAQAGAIVIGTTGQKRVAYGITQLIDKALALGADISVGIDADLQFDPEQMIDLIQPILTGRADFVVGDRFTDPETGLRRKPANMPVGKYLANRLGSWIVGLLSGQNFRDVTCGFRAYNRKAMLNFNINSKYTYTQESFQILALKRLDIASLPVVVRYFPGRKSRVVTSFWGFLTGSALNIIRAFRDHAPLRFFGYLGSLLFFIGAILDVFTIAHYLYRGSFSPYIFIAFAGIYFNSLGILVWIVGLLADMHDRTLNNQEKILYLLRAQRYGDIER